MRWEVKKIQRIKKECLTCKKKFITIQEDGDNICVKCVICVKCFQKEMNNEY